jgi:hypothetical protein
LIMIHQMDDGDDWEDENNWSKQIHPRNMSPP